MKLNSIIFQETDKKIKHRSFPCINPNNHAYTQCIGTSCPVRCWATNERLSNERIKFIVQAPTVKEPYQDRYKQALWL